jgi:uncharacterized caspase-like protein
VIGVNEAPQSHLASLNYALNDAESMAQTLQDDCGFTLLKPPLLGSEATSANVKKAVLSLAHQRDDNDFLLLYFSGHGQPMTVGGDQSDIYLVTSDFSKTETEADETLHCSMRWLQDKLYLPTQAGKVLLILDCCYAGNIGRTASDPYLEDLKMRIIQRQLLLLRGLIRREVQKDIPQHSFLRKMRLAKRDYLLSLILLPILNVPNPG